MGDYSPVRINGIAPFSSVASATIVGGQLLDATGDNTVGPSAGALHPVGVAANDAATGASVTVWPVSGVVHQINLVNTIAVVAGAPVITGAGGRINTGTLATVAGAGTLIGVCVQGGTGTSGGGTAASQARFIGTS